MAVVLALPKLVDDIDAILAADAAAADPPVDPVPSSFGWRAPAQRNGVSHRIVWVPGDDESLDVGALESPRQPGRNPRPLWTLGELFTVYLEAVDPADLVNERAQYVAARLLFDTWARAAYRAARGTLAFRSIRWVGSAKERRYGAALRVVGTIEAMVPDAPSEIAPVETTAEIDVEELGVTETITAPEEP